MREQTRPQTIGDIGEFGVIEAIRAVAPSSRNGDDAAVLTQTTPNARYVASTDMLVEGRHFRLDWSTPQQVGAKAAIQNFADIESMGARPTAILFGISAPATTPVSVVTGIAEGLWAQGKQCPAEIVGGDVVGGDSLVLSITAIGELGGPSRPLTRSAAKPGEILIASGPIGYSAAGLALLTQCGGPAKVPGRFKELIQAHCVPQFSYRRGATARAAGASALTDNSDGLVVDLATIASASGVTVDVNSEAIAPDDLLRAAGDFLGCDPWQWVLTGGEDHTLLGSIASAPPTDFRAIGTVSRKRADAVLLDGKPTDFNTGWVSF